jgi:hypothetical protein
MVATLCWTTPSAAQQTASAAAPAVAWTPPRTPDGQPDLQGRYMAQGIGTQPGVGTTGVRVRQANERQGVDLCSVFYRTDIFFEPTVATTLPRGVIDPPDGLVPMTPWAKARQFEIQKNGLNPTVANMFDVLGPDTLCLPGAPFPSAAATPYNGLQIVQGPGYVLLVSEWNHLSRYIPLDGSPHLGKDLRLWMADSRGRWEGNTLVVDMTNFNGKTFLDGNDSGTVASELLHIVERYTIVDADTIAYQATFEDPKAFTRNWTWAGSFHRMTDKNWELYEYACHEGNVRHIRMMLER